MAKRTTPKTVVPPRIALAAAYGLPPDTPDNVLRWYAGALLANNQAHTIKEDYDANNPPAARLSE